MQSKTKDQEYYIALILERCRQAGVSDYEFARRNGIKTVSWWRLKTGKTPIKLETANALLNASKGLES